jgi:G:T/U-mismatch repair DNA glycosylase
MTAHHILHLTRTHQISIHTEILLLGTFNPDTPGNTADFFYGRPRNFMWTLLPGAFGEPSLKNAPISVKRDFMQRYKIDFIDLIAEVEVEEATNYEDQYLDNKVIKWRDVLAELARLPHLKQVCFTRKSFSGIPKMKSRVEGIQYYCAQKGIGFHLLSTPSRFFSSQKETEWKSVLNPNIT